MTRILLLAFAAACVLAGGAACSRATGHPRVAPSGTAPSETSSPPRPTPPVLPDLPTPTASRTAPATPSRTAGFPEGTAVPCAGRPTADQVISLLRRTANVLPSGATVTVRTGPLCAGTWQYTVVSVPGVEPLQVLTRGAPSALTFVTAGTDVCTTTVRATAPVGILAAAHCT